MDAKRKGGIMNLFVRELRKLLALTKADPKSLAAGIIAPTIILVIFALTFGNFVALKLAVVNDDAGALGTAFEETVFSQTSPLSGEPYFEAIEADAGKAQELYEQGRVNGILTIPEDFSARLWVRRARAGALRVRQLQHRHGEEPAPVP